MVTKIRNILSGTSKNPIIIAEIGVNHNGDLDQAKLLIDAAKASGASAVKFQYFKAHDLARANPEKVTYQKKNEGENRSHYEMLKALEFDLDHHNEACKYSHENNMLFGTTIYNSNDCESLAEIDLDFIKVASADIIDHDIIKSIAQKDWFIILSTGASTIEEVTEASIILKDKLFCMMQCTSNYPASYSALNINVLESYRTFCSLIGYSDHSPDSLASQLALAKGACYFEKHLTLNKQLAGPDHIASLDPQDFKKYVDDIYHAADILGKSNKDVQPEEVDMRSTSRKSLHFSRNLRKGEKLKKTDIYLSRPGYGIYAKNTEDLLGKELVSDVTEGSLVSMELLRGEA